MIARLFSWLKPDPRPRPSRSPRWPAVRTEHLRTEPVCQACGGAESLQVHHIVPVHVDPARELSPFNLVTLCEKLGRNCHLAHGHAGKWTRWQPAVRKQLAVWRGWLLEATE